MTEIMNHSALLFDLMLAALLILSIWYGIRRGFAKMLAGLAGLGAAALLAQLCCAPVVNYIYEQVVRPYSEEAIAGQLERYNVGGTVRDALGQYGISIDQDILRQIAEEPDRAQELILQEAQRQTGYPLDTMRWQIEHTPIAEDTLKAINALPDWMGDAIVKNNSLENDRTRKQLMNTAAAILGGDEKKTAQMLTKQYIMPTAKRILRLVVLPCLFVAFSAVLKIIVFLLVSGSQTLPGHLTDQTAGAVIGIVQGGMLIWLTVQFTAWMLEVSTDVPFFNQRVIDQTTIFRYFFERFR